MKLSGIVIAKNGEKFIKDCLESLSFCDEIIVVDGGSTDRTISIANKFKTHVIPGQSNDFAKQRNIGLAVATGEWVLYIDTDERISQELQKSIKDTLVNQSLKSTAYKLQRKNFYLGNHQWPKIEKLERLFKKESLKQWKGQLHESPDVAGNIGELSGFLYHYTHTDLSSMLKKTNQWSTIEAKLRLQNGHPSMAGWRFFRVMITAFTDSYITQRGWKIGTAGLVESIYQCFSIFTTYAKLWELQQINENK